MGDIRNTMRYGMDKSERPQVARGHDGIEFEVIIQRVAWVYISLFKFILEASHDKCWDWLCVSVQPTEKNRGFMTIP